jgi:hypothetical protein
MAENDEKIQQARDMKDKAENLKNQTKDLNTKGMKKEALAKMREFKEAQAQFDAFIEENPDILAEMYIDNDEKPVPKANVSPPVVKPNKSKVLSVEEIYDKYHDVEEMNSIKVVENELERCK